MSTGCNILVGTAGAVAANPDADLIRVCHQFAEKELDDWYRYVVDATIAPGTEDEDTPPDWAGLHWIEATPATTPEGWQAKALAFSAWHRDSYDNAPEDQDSQTALLAGLLRDMVAPARNAIVTRLAAKYGPLPTGYTAEGIWLGAAVAYEPTQTGRAGA